MALSKKELRSRAKDIRASLRSSRDLEHKVAQIFIDEVTLDMHDVVAGYSPANHEISPLEILTQLENVTVLPIVQQSTRVLKFAHWKGADPLCEGAYGIREPVINAKTMYSDPTIIIVPLLAFDTEGNRLGYGGGYYDATLEYLRQKSPVIAIGIAFQEQLFEEGLPSEAHDQPLDLVITPERSYRFKT